MSDKKKILVIEDDAFLANAYRMRFSKAGYEIALAADGAEGLIVFESFHPDIVILDLLMPVKDGFSTLEEIRSEKSKDIPVIVCSNLGQQEDIDNAKKRGANDFFIKSNGTLDELLKKIEKFLGTVPPKQ